MANEIFKELKTRIALKYNTYEYWTTGEGKDYAPLKGEVCFCAIENKEQGAQTAPTILFKVGVDGITTFSELKWASALAADVYDWAKVAGANVFTKDGEGNVVSGIEYDADLNDGKGGFKFTTASVATAEGLAAIERDIADNRDAWVKDDNDNTTYQFSIPTEGDDKGKLLVEKKEIGESTWTRVDAYDFVTPGELAETLNGYYNKDEVDGLIQGVRDDIPTELGVMSVELLSGTENGSLKLKVNGVEGEDVPVTGLEKIKVENAVHADAAGQVDKTLTVKVGGETKTYNGSADVEADVDAAITAAINAIPEVVHPKYSIVKDTTSEHAATYHLTKDGVNVGAAINIPKDMVVEHGEVVELTEGEVEGYPAGTYIKLTLSNATSDTLYIAVGELIEYVTSGSADGDMVYVTVDSATHKVTATITDGTITEAKLHEDVTDKLNKTWATTEQGGKADTALQNIEVGTGLTVTNKVTGEGEEAVTDPTTKVINIDEEVIFVLDCNY